MDQRQHYRALTRAVQQLLLNQWDPIGIKHEAQCRDEYDTYAPEIVRLLLAGSEVNELAAYLYHVATMTMGLLGQRDRDVAIAQQLLSTYQNLPRA